MIKTTQTWKIGDCLELMKSIPDKSIDLVLTDPPYGIGMSLLGKIGSNNAGKVTDYGISDWDKTRINKEYFEQMFRVSKNQIIFGGNYYTDYLYPTPCWIVWHKDNTGNFADCELAWCSFKSAVRYFKYRWNGMLQEEMKNKEVRVHPTQKPTRLFEWILKKYSKEGDTILDPFLGSGTTLEACMRSNKNGIGFEINPQYEQYYIKRLHLDTSKIVQTKQINNLLEI